MGAQPPFADKMVRTTFPYGKHGDDMMLVYIESVDRLKKAGGLGGRSEIMMT